MKRPRKVRPLAKHSPGRAPGTGSPSSHGLRLVLVVLLGLAVVLLISTRRWRDRLLAESAQYREVIRSTEEARSERSARQAQERELAERVRKDPDDPDARFELAQLRWSLHGPPTAIPILQAWPADRPESRALRMLAECYRLVGREDRALPLLDRAAVLYPKDEEIFADRALFFSRVSWLPEAKAALQKMDRQGGATAHVEMVRIAIARESGDLRSAHRLLAAAKQREPANASVLQQLAAVLNEEGEPTAAIRLLEAAAEPGSDPESSALLARILVERSVPADMPRALAALDAVRAARPFQPGEELLRARCLRLSGRAQEAKALLDDLHRRVPTLPGLAFERAQVQRMTSADGDAVDLAALMAQHEREQREEAEMRRAVLALRLHASDPATHAAVGLLCLQRRLYGRAALELHRAEAMGSRDPKVGDGLERARRELAKAEASRASQASRPRGG